ncbi:MAG: hypothetical protein Q9222_003697 [Ikaeria aurantiellina]
MNNTQFRRLVLDTPTASHSSNGATSTSTNATRPQATPSALGSRMRSNVPSPIAVQASTSLVN